MVTKPQTQEQELYPECASLLMTSPLSQVFVVKEPKIGLHKKFKKLHLDLVDTTLPTNTRIANTLSLDKCISISKQNFNTYTNNKATIVYTDSPDYETPFTSISLDEVINVIHNDASVIENFISPSNGGFINVDDVNTSNNNNCNIQVDTFDSLFEEGNLRLAIEVNKNEYDLIMRKDINNEKNYSWFFFEYTSHEAKDVKFNIINFPKKKLLFGDGVRVLTYNNKHKWNRNTFNVHYYQNDIPMPLNLVDNTNNKEDDEIIDDNSNSNTLQQKNTSQPIVCYYTTLTFSYTITDELKGAPIYFAYCFPYTYTNLQQYLLSLSLNPKNKNMLKFGVLNKTICGNPLDVVYISNFNNDNNITNNNNYSGNSSSSNIIQDIDNNNNNTNINNNNNNNEDKSIICLTARVHPGESNSSYVIEGVIDALLSNIADDLRSKYIFKIIPMLNPDGVINGNYRNNIIGKDLNRLWSDPRKNMCPTIYHSKKFISQNKPIFYCDFHGHSSIPNCCLYGCSQNAKQSKKILNKAYRYHEERVFMRIFEKNAHYYNKGSSRYTISKPKIRTARAVVYNELGVTMSYCLETSTMCVNSNNEIISEFTIEGYKMVGEDFVRSVKKWSNKEVFFTVLKKIRTEVEEKKKKKESKKLVLDVNGDNTNHNNVVEIKVKKKKKLTLNNDSNSASMKKMFLTVGLGDEKKKIKEHSTPGKNIVFENFNDKKHNKEDNTISRGKDNILI